MTTKVISFLGIKAQNTVYEYHGKSYQGNLFQIALRQFMNFDEMLVFATPEAKRETYPYLERLDDPRIKLVDIRRGTTSDGLWQIFNQLVQNVDDGDTVIFDITHGLRSIFFLTFLASAYLRSAKQKVKIEAILYGAYDLRQDDKPAPVIDLSEFVGLLDWLTATNEFVKTGNAAALAEQLSQSNEPTLLPLAETVKNIATGLHLLRPKETSAAAAALPQNLNLAHEVLPPPFTLLSESIQINYGRFGQAEKTTPRDQLGYQLQMINWYHQRGQFVHALSLGREWLVSLLCLYFKLDEKDMAARAEMEFLIGGGKTGEKISLYFADWATVPDAERLRRLWGSPYQLANLRNDVLHSGFRKNPKPAVEVKWAVDEAIKELNSIANEAGFTRQNPNSEATQ